MPEREIEFKEFHIDQLNPVFIAQHVARAADAELSSFFEVRPVDPEINYALFLCRLSNFQTAYVSVSLEHTVLRLTCDCGETSEALCAHQAQVLLNIAKRDDLRIFFDEHLRQERLKAVAAAYGMENEERLDQYFKVEYHPQGIDITPKSAALLKVDAATKKYLAERLLPAPVVQVPQQPEASQLLLVLRKHKYYQQFQVELYSAAWTAQGKVKNPLIAVNPLDLIWKSNDAAVVKFYSALSRFGQYHDGDQLEQDALPLQALVNNPLALPVYRLKEDSRSVSANGLIKIELRPLQLDIRITVNQAGNFYEVIGHLVLDEKLYLIENLQIRFNYFLEYQHTFYLIDNPYFLKLIEFFRKHQYKILVHQTKFDEFQRTILSKLEDKVQISYSFLKAATDRQLKENNFDAPPGKLVYLSGEGDYILITPVVRYGNVEVPVLSKKVIYSVDGRGRPFTVIREDEMELRLIALLIRQHPHFEEQLDQKSFYLHKKRFLEEGWFLEAFEEWRRDGITILGFNDLEGNKFNAHPVRVDIKVLSGLDWFETEMDLKFGDQKVSLKYLQKALRDKSKFVQLGDGTLGILPEEWVAKLSKYFEAGQVIDDKLRTPKSKFAEINDLYDQTYLDEDVQLEIARMSQRISEFSSFGEMTIPNTFKGALRPYQQQGLRWLCFLDDFGFGGCLADDMGLGKTIQVIAFLLKRKEKQPDGPASLVVVPTTLVGNWEQELAKFAPSLRVYINYGATRAADGHVFGGYDVVITTYGTLLSDLKLLKKYTFATVFFDESQAIKNPSSQRYKAAAVLQSRSKITITGTPLENNTFDLYAQLSLANPGLLGTRQFFKDCYSTPIDKFKDSRRLAELQKKISPFILRRTKKQVATELPEKTEMVIYCEMGEEQRKIYDAHRIEFRDFLASNADEEAGTQQMHVLRGITVLRQICNSPALLKGDSFYGHASAKIDTLLEDIESKHQDHKILVFSQFVSMLDLIRGELDRREIGYQYLTGQTKNRTEKVNSFREDPKMRVFLISLKAGGTGLNLTEADYVYLVDPWWNPATENQAIDRSYRIGQDKKVVAVRLICPDTIEEKMMRLQATKRDLANELIKAETDVLKRFTKDDLLELFN